MPSSQDGAMIIEEERPGGRLCDERGRLWISRVLKSELEWEGGRRLWVRLGRLECIRS